MTKAIMTLLSLPEHFLSALIVILGMNSVKAQGSYTDGITATNQMIYSATGEMTKEEIESCKGYLLNRLKAATGPVYNNGYMYGAEGRNLHSCIQMYEITLDLFFLNRAIECLDAAYYYRNGQPGGDGFTVRPFNKVADVWVYKNENSSYTDESDRYYYTAAVEQGEALEHFAYAAKLILKNKDIWNVPVAAGDRYGYGMTYKERALKYLEICDKTYDDWLCRFVHEGDNVFYSLDSNGTPTSPIPFNQSFMGCDGLDKMAQCHALLDGLGEGGDHKLRAETYDRIVGDNLKFFVSEAWMDDTLVDGKSYLQWYYNCDYASKKIEDITHGSFDAYILYNIYAGGRHNDEDLGLKTGLGIDGIGMKPLVREVANTLTDLVFGKGKNADGVFPYRINGKYFTDEKPAEAPKGDDYIRAYYYYLAEFRPDFADMILEINGNKSLTNIQDYTRMMWCRTMTERELDFDAVRYALIPMEDRAYAKVWQDTDVKDITVKESIHYNNRDYPVTEVAAGCFDADAVGVADLKSVSVPTGIEVIGEKAFYKQGQLASVTCKGVKKLGNDVFGNCRMLKNIELPELEEISGTATFQTTGLTSFYAPKLKTLSGRDAFRNSQSLAEFNAPLLETISGGRTFNACKRLRDVYIPRIKTIAAGSFGDNSANVDLVMVYMDDVTGVVARNDNFDKAKTVFKIPYNKIAEYQKDAGWQDAIFERTIDEKNTTAFTSGNYYMTVERAFAPDLWTPIVLPATVSAEKIAEAFGNGVELSAYTGATRMTNDEYCLHFRPAHEVTNGAEGELTAGIPLMIRVADGSPAAKGNIVLGTVSVLNDNGEATCGDAIGSTPTWNPDNGAFAFCGTYVTTDAANGIQEGDYFWSKGTLYESVNTGALKTTRAIFKQSATNSARAHIVGFSMSDDVTLGIDGRPITGNNADRQGNNGIYNLSGQRVSENYRGMVIRNGKKYYQNGK